MDAKSDKGGYIGIFFMAFTLALVSFSCTGPIIGTLLVEASLLEISLDRFGECLVLL
jgi:cytochrome c biogenesis protein CcdA